LKHRYVRTLGAVAMAALLFGGAAACGGDDGDGGGGGGEQTTVKIGFMGDLTGPNANIVIPPRNGAKLAIDEYNATNPDIKIELVEYDSQGNPDTAKNLAQQAVQTDKIVGLIGPAFSGESATAVPIMEEAKIPSVSPSATAVSLAEQGWKYWHRVVANDGVQGPAAAKAVVRLTGAKKVFVTDERDEYSLGLGNAVRDTLKADGIANQSDQIDPEGSDYSSTINKIKAFAPDAVFHAGYYAAGGKFLKQLRDAGVTVPFVTGDGALDQSLVTTAGAAQAEEAIVSCPCVLAPAADTPEAKKFTEDYKAAYNTDPAVYATEGFDAASVFIQAFKAGHSEPDAINNFIGSLSFAGVAKEIKFAPTGEPGVESIFLYQVKDGRLALLGEADKATLD
jgi:branched-chain amino acid transport system substrate-binding protein